MPAKSYFGRILIFCQQKLSSISEAQQSRDDLRNVLKKQKKNKRGLSCAKFSPWSTSFLGPMELFLVVSILSAEYPNSAGRILRFCRQNMDILPAEYGYSASRIRIFCRQNLDTMTVEYFAISYIISIYICTI